MSSKTITPRPEERPYQPIGAALDVFYCQDDEVVTDGPAGTGKSRGCLEKMHLCAMKYSGMRGLLVRKTRTSISQTALVTYENHVLPVGALGKGRLVHFFTSDQEYRYKNGSVLVVGGLDKSSKIMSSEYDMIFMQEATEATEDDWEALTTRLRNGVMPYQQLLADCNPQNPKHFLKQRQKRGVLKMFQSRHEDNPVLFNQQTREMTPRGVAYLAKLDNLTGVRYLRLRKGLWVQAEGMIWDNYDPKIHLLNRYDENDEFIIPRDWRRFWVVDFGYRNPFVWQEWAMDNDGNLYRIREIYFTNRLVEDHAREILKVCGWHYDPTTRKRTKIREDAEPLPQKIICDHDAEDRATLEKHLGMATVPAFKDVSSGLQQVESRLRVKANGKAGLYLLRDSLVERDPELVEAKKPLCTEDEIEEYVWDEDKEAPVKENDHGCDCMRYMVAEIDLKPRGDDYEEESTESYYQF
ncbi:MAG TPA: phage terminase large subunit [Pyrinomonadaceae bacterium]|jgi:phage terminase large subunit